MKVFRDTYRHVIKGYLAITLFLSLGEVIASSDQNMISKSLVSMGINIGDAAPVIAYNPAKSEYFVVYTDFDQTCSSNQELRGQVINAITGEKSGGEINLTTSALPCAVNILSDPKIIFNEQQNEYLIFYKTTTSLGAEIKFLTVSANTYQIITTPVTLDQDEIADPFRSLVVGLDISSNIYSLGYHTENALSESSLTIKYVNGSSKSVLGFSTNLDKNQFGSENKGLFTSRFIYANNLILAAYEVRFTAGSEIHGCFINTQTGNISGDMFQISPDGSTTSHYLHPALSYNPSASEVLVVYEKARAIGQNYALNHKIHGQIINSTNGNLLAPVNQALTTLPSTPYEEDSKFPSICYSDLSDEYIIAFYGIRYAAGTDLYNIYLQRIDANSISPISSASREVIGMVGTQVVENNFLKSLPLSFNKVNNQFLLGWNVESNNGINVQVWRYDNNPPTNLTISSTTRNEELPIGTTFGTLSADDPDPEDDTPVFTLASGNGSQDNIYFIIQGDQLKTNRRLSFEDAPTRSIRVRVTDSQGKNAEMEFTLTISNVDEPPTSISLSGPLSIEENALAALFSSTITAADDDAGDTHTFTLVSGDSSDHNANFEIDPGTNILKLIEPLNYEEAAKRYVRLKAVDFSGLPYEKAFVINVLDVNEKPEKLELTPNSIPENDAESVAVIHVIDPDDSPSYSFTKISGDGDEDNDLFSLTDNNKLSPITPLNFEEKSIYSVRLRAWDGVYDTTQAISINVTDVNDPPEAVSLSEHQIVADQPAGSFFAHISTIDQDVNDSHTYDLIEGSEYFFIRKTGDNYDLHILNSFTYDFTIPENNLYSLRIQSIDAGGIAIEESINVEVVLYKDEENPELRFINQRPAYVDRSASNLNLSVQISDNEKLDTAYFFYKPIRTLSGFKQTDSIVFDVLEIGKIYNFSVLVNAEEMDDMGIEYYFKAIDAAGNGDSTEVYRTYWSYDSKKFTVTGKTYNSYEGNAESYRIIANPYTLENNKVSKIFSDYGSSSEQSWRLFSYENTENKEISSVLGSRLEQGKGYWFNKMENLNQVIELDNARTTSNHNDNPYLLNLKPGWNLIGNPYPFELDWNFVLEENGKSAIEFPLYSYDGNYRPIDVLKEFEGAFVFANNHTSLTIPLSDPSLSNNRLAYINPFENGWLVTFTLDNGHLKNRLGGLGMHENANQSYDQFDRPLLPRFFLHLDMTFNHPEHIAEAFSQDIAKLQDNHIWEFVVSSTDTKNPHVTLSWSTDLFSKNNNKLILYDVLRNETINLKDDSHYKFKLEGPSTFKAIYGDETFIESSLNKIQIEALQPYPNPFSESVILPINLPYSQSTYYVQYSMYNLMGEKIFEKEYQNVQHGLHSVEWSEDDISNLKQGIYIYSIKVRNGFLTDSFHGRIVKN